MVKLTLTARAALMCRLRTFGKAALCTLLLGSAALSGLAGCGQKGALVLPEKDSQAMVATEAMSGAYPQDAAFERVDDDAYRKARYLEQQQLLAEIEADPNDY